MPGLTLIILLVIFCIRRCIFPCLEVFAAGLYEEVRRKIAAHEIESVSKFALIQSTKDFSTNSDFSWVM